ncbi:hypothetical protein [Marinobacterium lutimaris]|uniref:Uncharacterized protein n=1 Tax=Marinobacterium lutimaris TaxID=568106 RepID=A0A1H6C9T9_9GAMM|nr:hypothetical protein [Marinobacterium lutimaris]SEG69730.1 hypothetical protein SAMN05444390_103311 [Marinobacterium lutimaris]
MEKLKRKISTIILDSVEGLPKFRKGLISELQEIRERQRNKSLDHAAERECPNNTEIKLNCITYILTFEHEDFNSLINGLRKYFTKNDKVKKITSSLKESKDSLYSLGWYNLANIVKKEELYFPDREIDSSLPEEVKYLALSFHRILPSVGCIIFEFYLEDYVSENLNEIQRKKYIAPVVFKKFWPLRKIARRYSSGVGNEDAIEAINEGKDSVRAILKKWIRKEFSWRSVLLDSGSYIDVYEINGNPKENIERKAWLNKKLRWLEEYGLTQRDFELYVGEDILLSKKKDRDGKFKVSNIVAKIDSKNDSEFGDFFDFKVRAVAISSITFGVIDKYRKKIERLRGDGFKSLYKRRKINRRSQDNIQEIKRAIVIISRLQHELTESSYWISDSISEVGDLECFLRENPHDLGKYTIDTTQYQLKVIKDSAKIIDAGLTGYLTAQSIYVMYKLQKRMFILSIVVTVATIFGVASEWENIKNIVPIGFEITNQSSQSPLPPVD